MKNYGEILKKERIARNLTQKQLANAIHISQQAISFYENNINEPSISVCEKLADYYGISIDDLVGHEVKKNWI